MTTHNHPATIGKYEILSVLGKGGMGIVYKARDPIIDRVVAIKTISGTTSEGLEENQLQRLQMEARSAGRLHHPNIVTVYDFGQQDTLSYIVMEYAEGVDLGQLILARQPLSLPAKIDILLQICHGLAFAHDAGVTHRDMKPGNVRLTTAGIAKLLDFGLARFDNTQLTKSGFISGTIAYMSPERLHGQAGQSDDVFALGAVAYELLTYQRAFPGATPPEVMMKIVSQTPPPPSTVAEVPAVLDDVVLKCMAREVADRFESAHDFAQALEEAFESEEAQLFVTDPARSEEFKETLRTWVPPRRRRDTRSRPISDSQIRILPEATEPLDPTSAHTPPSGTASDFEATALHEPPIDQTVTSQPRAMTTTMREQRRSKTPMIGAAIAALVLVAILGAILMRNTPQAAPAATNTTPTTAATSASVAVAPVVAAPTSTVAVDDRVERARGELLSLTQQVATKLTTARNDGIAVAQPKLNEVQSRVRALERHAEAGADDHVRNEAKKILADFDAAIRRSPRTASVGAPVIQETRPTPVAAVTPTPAPVAQPRVEEQSVPQTPPPAPPQPPAATATTAAATPMPSQPAPKSEPRTEVMNFIRRVATAYSTRDDDFFRQHHLGYTPAMANGIRNSPSTKVELQVESVTIDGDRARVIVQRTDEFGGSAPTAKQRLAYQLERTADGWKIRRFERQ